MTGTPRHLLSVREADAIRAKIRRLRARLLAGTVRVTPEIVASAREAKARGETYRRFAARRHASYKALGLAVGDAVRAEWWEAHRAEFEAARGRRASP